MNLHAKKSSRVEKRALNDFTNVILRSVETPGEPEPVVIIARVVATSTTVAVNPPCKPPARFTCDSSTWSSNEHLPSLTDTTDIFRATRSKPEPSVNADSSWRNDWSV